MIQWSSDARMSRFQQGSEVMGIQKNYKAGKYSKHSENLILWLIYADSLIDIFSYVAKFDHSPYPNLN